jgi:hypothetical protein
MEPGSSSLRATDTPAAASGGRARQRERQTRTYGSLDDSWLTDSWCIVPISHDRLV